MGHIDGYRCGRPYIQGGPLYILQSETTHANVNELGWPQNTNTNREVA